MTQALVSTKGLTTYFIEERGYLEYWEAVFERVGEEVQTFSKADWMADLFDSLWFSYSSIICHHFEENESFYAPYFKEEEDVEGYSERFLWEKGQMEPFKTAWPKAFEEALSLIAEELLSHTAHQLKA